MVLEYFLLHVGVDAKKETLWLVRSTCERWRTQMCAGRNSCFGKVFKSIMIIKRDLKKLIS